MKAIILSAGQGSRLLPLTNDTPKCLLPVGPFSVLEWQVRALDRCSQIEEIVVVTGFMADKVDAAVRAFPDLQTPIKTLFNPFYKAADNLASCWMAREHMDGDFLIVNGDSLFELSVLNVILQDAAGPINLTTNLKSDFDSDDMKVTLNGRAVQAVGKTLSSRETDAESIGLVYFRNDGARLFVNRLEALMRDGTGLSAWYLQVIDQLAKEGHVSSTDIGELTWGEIDFPADLEEAQLLVTGWQRPRSVA